MAVLHNLSTRRWTKAGLCTALIVGGGWIAGSKYYIGGIKKKGSHGRADGRKGLMRRPFLLV
jgi:hypothetical protein